MSWSSYISATDTLAGAAVWFNAFYNEFAIYLYIGGGVILAIGMINLLRWAFEKGMFHLSRDFRMDVLRREHRNFIQMDRQNLSDWELWRRTKMR